VTTRSTDAKTLSSDGDETSVRLRNDRDVWHLTADFAGLIATNGASGSPRTRIGNTGDPLVAIMPPRSSTRRDHEAAVEPTDGAGHGTTRPSGCPVVWPDPEWIKRFCGRLVRRDDPGRRHVAILRRDTTVSTESLGEQIVSMLIVSM
jgi:hypothetical protein